MIRQDSILELSVGCAPSTPVAPGSAPGPRLVRSMSRDAALDASGEAVLLRRQVELLQEELSRLRLKAEESNKKGAGSGKKKKKNKGKGDASKDQQVRLDIQENSPGEANAPDVCCVYLQVNKEPEPQPLAPLAIEDPIDQLDGLEEGNEEEEEVMKISPRSDSPRGSYRQPFHYP